jgi:YHS domain-containing protein
MMLEDLLWLVISAVVARAVWRVVEGVMDGLSGQPRGPRPSAAPGGAQSSAGTVRGGKMVRDPVCGTHVLPGRAVVLSEGAHQVFFCSTACRDSYRAHPPARADRAARAHGRTA